MNFRGPALILANIADKLTYVSRRRTIDGQKVYVLPPDEVAQMKSELLEISHLLNDLQDERDRK